MNNGQEIVVRHVHEYANKPRNNNSSPVPYYKSNNRQIQRHENNKDSGNLGKVIAAGVAGFVLAIIIGTLSENQ